MSVLVSVDVAVGALASVPVSVWVGEGSVPLQAAVAMASPAAMMAAPARRRMCRVEGSALVLVAGGI